MPTFPPNVHVPQDMPCSSPAVKHSATSDTPQKPQTVPAPTSSAQPATEEKPKASWRNKLRLQKKYGAEGSGKERWRDSSLNEKERWKGWQKAKDKERQRNSTAGYYTQFYKGKGKKIYWLAALWES